MPELPDITVYLDALDARLTGRRLTGLRISSPFLLRSVDPPVEAVVGREVLGFRRLGKRIVFKLTDEHFIVLHLMIAGRLAWKGEAGAKLPGRVGLAAFDFEHGTLLLREAAKKKRASLHLVRGEDALATFDPGGAEPLACTLSEFTDALRCENHTLKRSLTDPRLLSGIGNAYSDELLHRAQLSPVQLTKNLDDAEIARLFEATQAVLREWIERLRAETGEGFPERVTAFREEMAVHGKYGEPCPVCGTKVQRIKRKDNEVNYCPGCQTKGKLLADRGLSRLLAKDWPKTVEEMEQRLQDARRS